MSQSTDWRDIFCGRESELDALLDLFQQVNAGAGPRLAVVLGDRGMGKTRLVQQLYRRLSKEFDPHDYWPDGSLFDGQALQTAPRLELEQVRTHYSSFSLQDRPMPFLWWGLRLHDPKERNVAVGDLASHRRTLEPHLAYLQKLRELNAAHNKQKAVARDIGFSMAKDVAKIVVEQVSGAGVVRSVFDFMSDYAEKCQAAALSGMEWRLEAAQLRSLTLTGADERLRLDLLSSTLDDLAAVMSRSAAGPGLPTVVFCDDAQFAGTQGDDGAFRLITQLWERAHLAGLPLLLVLTHWGVEWRQRVAAAPVTDSREVPSRESTLAAALYRSAESAHFGRIIDLPREPAMAQLVQAGLPGLTLQDQQLLLSRSDGNPEALVELVLLVQRMPAWRTSGGALASHGRQAIEQRPTQLMKLILDRLQSEVTPESVRRVAALASAQGMEFLRPLLEKAAESLQLPNTADGLEGARQPHRLVADVDEGVLGFVQRAYHEAARELIGGYVGDPQGVEHALLNASVDLWDHPDRWSALTRAEQQATLGVIASLDEKQASTRWRQRAGRALLTLCGMSMSRRSGTDIARAAALARRFEQGLGRHWEIDQFGFAELWPALDALRILHGNAAARTMSDAALVVARTRATEGASQSHLNDLCSALGFVGDAIAAQGDLASAEALYSENLQIARALGSGGSSPDPRRWVWNALVRMGQVYTANGQWQKAQDAYQECLELARALDLEQSTPQTQLDVACSLQCLGSVHAAQQDWVRAAPLQNASLAIHRQLVQVSATVESRVFLMASLTHLADTWNAQEQWSQAEGLVVECLRIARAMSHELSMNEALRNVVSSLDRLGRIRQALGDPRQSEEYFTESLVLAREYSDLLNTPESRYYLVVALNKVGEARKILQDWHRAEECFREAVAIGRGVAANLRTPQSQVFLAHSLAGLGGCRHALSDWAGAKTYLGECLAIRRLLAEQIRTPAALREVVSSLEMLGDMTQARGDIQEATGHYRDGTCLSRALARQLDTPKAWDELSNLLGKAGAASQAQGAWKEADADYRESLEIRRRLNEQSCPPQSLRHLAWLLKNLMVLQHTNGQLAEAADLCLQGLDVQRALNARLGTPQSQRELSTELWKGATVLIVWKDLDSAEPLLRECIALSQQMPANLQTTEDLLCVGMSWVMLGSIASERAASQESLEHHLRMALPFLDAVGSAAAPFDTQYLSLAEQVRAVLQEAQAPPGEG